MYASPTTPLIDELYNIIIGNENKKEYSENNIWQ